jgi:hypothetical protein
MGRDIIRPRANGSPNLNFGRCYVKYLDDAHGEYVGILSNDSTVKFMNDYTGRYLPVELDARYIFMPCQTIFLKEISDTGIHMGSDINNIFELIVVRGFLQGYLEEAIERARREAIERARQEAIERARREAAASVGEDPTPPHRGGRRKKSSKRRLMRRKSVRKLKKD